MIKSGQGNQNNYKSDDKKKNRPLECADPSARAMGKKIGFQLLPIYCCKKMSKSGSTPSHHSRWHHVVLGHRLEQRKTGPGRRLNWMGLGSGTHPILNGARHQKVPRERGSRNDNTTHTNAWYECILLHQEGYPHKGGRAKVLTLLIFLKEIQSKMVKAHMCADGL